MAHLSWADSNERASDPQGDSALEWLTPKIDATDWRRRRRRRHRGRSIDRDSAKRPAAKQQIVAIVTIPCNKDKHSQANLLETVNEALLVLEFNLRTSPVCLVSAFACN